MEQRQRVGRPAVRRASHSCTSMCSLRLDKRVTENNENGVTPDPPMFWHGLLNGNAKGRDDASRNRRDDI